MKLCRILLISYWKICRNFVQVCKKWYILFIFAIYRIIILESGYSSDHSESNRSYDALAFREFLSSHVDKAFSQGFDDNMGRNAVPAFFEVFMKKFIERFHANFKYLDD